MTMALTQVTTGGVDENINIDSNTLKVDGTNNRVGVGTDAPGALLDVKASSSRQIRVATESSNNAGLVQCTESSGNNRDIALGGQNVTFCVGAFDATSRSEAGRFDTSGRLLLGTTSAGGNGTADDLVVANNASANDQAGITIRGGTSGRSQIFFSDGTSGEDEYRGMLRYDHQDNSMQFRTNASEKLRITSAGNVGLGTSAPDTKLHLQGDDGNFIKLSHASRVGSWFIQHSGTNSESLDFQQNDGSTTVRSFFANRNMHAWYTDGTEKLRVDSSGRLLVGTTTNIAPDGFASKIQTAGTDYQGGSISIRRDQNSASGPTLTFTKSRSSVIGGTTVVQSGDVIGQLTFYGADGGDVNQAAGYIRSRIDGTPGGNDMPGRLEFHTTADGAASPTEQLRITRGGLTKLQSQKGLQINGYGFTLDNNWKNLETWTAGGNKGAGGSILAITSNHTGTSSGKISLTHHYIQYNGNIGQSIDVKTEFNVDLRTNNGILQVRGFDSGTGLNTSGYVTLIYFDSRQHINV